MSLNWRAEQGFTLIEIVIGLIVAGIIITGSIIGIQHYQQQRKLILFAKALYHDLKWARIEAIVLNQSVVLEPVAADWCQGWRVLAIQSSIDTISQNISQHTSNSHELKYQLGIQPCYIRMSSFPQRNYYRFSPLGISDYQNGSYYIYPNVTANTDHWTHKITINQAGRIRFE